MPATKGNYWRVGDSGKTNDEVTPSQVLIWNGWPASPGVTLSFDNGTRTFTVTDGGSAYYYNEGVTYTLAGNHTVVITDTEGLWYIYFVGDTLTASQTPWVLADGDKVMVAVLYWDATNNEEILLGYELHGYDMPAATHARFHHGGGSAWESGLLVSDAGAEDVNVSAGEFHDEDIEIDITDGAGGGLFEQVLSPAELPIYYRDGATAWRVFDTGDKSNATDLGYVTGGNDLQWNELNGGVYQLTNVTAGRHIAMFVIATNDQTEPVALIMGQREDVLLSAAEENNVFSGLDLTGIPFTEMVILSRAILKEVAGGVFYTLESLTDLRGTNAAGNVTTPIGNDHGALAGLGDDDHAQYILKSLFDAHSILYSITDNVPGPLTVSEQTLVGRITGGNIAALSVAQVRKLLYPRRSMAGLNFNAFDFLLDESIPPRFDIAQHRPVLIFDQTTIDKAYTRARRMPSDYGGGTLEATILYSMVSDVSPKTLYFDVAVEAITPNTGGNSGDTTDLDTTSSFDTDNTGNDTVPDTTAGKLGELTITLTNDDSVAAGDLVRFRLQTNTTGDAVDDSRVYSMEVSEVMA
jgi:hypothetical protein